MTITVQALQADGTWGVRSAFTTENAKVRAGSMTAADLEALARATMAKWQQTSCDGKQLRVHNSDNDPKPSTKRRIETQCADCGEVIYPNARSGDEDDDFYCSDCDDIRSERAWDRFCEDFHGGGGQIPLIEQQRQALRLK